MSVRSERLTSHGSSSVAMPVPVPVLSCPTTAILEAPRAPASLACQASCLDATLTSDAWEKARGNLPHAPRGRGGFALPRQLLLCSLVNPSGPDPLRGPGAFGSRSRELAHPVGSQDIPGIPLRRRTRRPGTPNGNDPATRPRIQAAILTRFPAHYHREKGMTARSTLIARELGGSDAGGNETPSQQEGRMQRCSCAPPACHATPAAEGRNSTHLGNAQDSRHVEFRYPAPRRAWRRGAVAAPSPLALQRPSSCQAALPKSEGWLSGSVCTPTAGPFAGSHLSSIRPGQQIPCFSTRTRARPLMPCHDGARDDVESARRENSRRPALLALAERPMVFAWGSLAFGCGTRKPTQICAWRKPRPSPPWSPMHLFLGCSRLEGIPGFCRITASAKLLFAHDNTLCRSRGMKRRV